MMVHAVVGQAVWCHVGNGEENELVQGTVVHVFELSDYMIPRQYVVEIPTSIDPLLVVRDGFTISDSADRPIGFWRR